jgi:hypothetical protein
MARLGKSHEIVAGNGRGKVRLLTRDALDNRTRAARQFDAIAEGIAQDLGGEDGLRQEPHRCRARGLLRPRPSAEG